MTKKHTSIRLTPANKDWLEKQAEQQDRSVSYLIDDLIGKYRLGLVTDQVTPPAPLSPKTKLQEVN